MSTPSIVSLDDKTTNASHISNAAQENVDDYIAKFLDMSNTAKAEDERDKTMPLKECIKTFPKACFWSVVLSSALIMEGYDTNLLASFTLIKVLLRNLVDITKIWVNTKSQQRINLGCQCVIKLVN